ncbi:fibronectin type 3 and ankyrin repeat domains protein 1-like [Hydractinia symbiolongicarpus]|uniref:fibronectin type 3 and ankyrin repeat domains protein 1-like n=1 Tax=Hydractinia symbiolongicarpus TaxID=13093 RepID=UPI00254FB1E3|nr:fibronectin type 3 and ankyrin repeat domains protein 1-like [Hydractinia symbiolongicarpus]
MECAGDPPHPPVVGKVTPFSIELLWKNALVLENRQQRVKYIVQEEELGGLVTKGYGTVYSGFAHRNTFTGLEPRTLYRYRIKYKFDNYETPYSRPVEVATTKKPPSGDDLHRAVQKNDIKSVVKLLQVLPNELIHAPDKYGYSALMTVAFKGFKHLAEILLENNADVSYQNNNGKNALLMACYAGKLEMVKLLREKGAVWESSDNNGSTPLHLAVDGGNVDLIRWMIKDGCPVDTKDRTSGWTPLMRLASTNGDVNAAEILIAHKANIDASDNDRKSVLMMAALNGHSDLVKLLLSKGAKIDSKSMHNKTALDFARSFEYEKIVQMLEDKYKEMRFV